MRRDKPLVVTVTAPKGGPGKTMVSMLLGYAAARMGLRVLVVGCGIANDEHTDRAKLMLTQAAGRVPTLRDRPYPQQWWRDPVTGYQVVPAARAKLDRQRDIVLADVRWLLRTAAAADAADASAMAAALGQTAAPVAAQGSLVSTVLPQRSCPATPDGLDTLPSRHITPALVSWKV